MTNLMSRIERLLRNGEVTASRLGREAVHDPSFVHGVRNGRRLRPETEARVHAWLDTAEKAEERKSCAR